MKIVLLCSLIVLLNSIVSLANPLTASEALEISKKSESKIIDKLIEESAQNGECIFNTRRNLVLYKANLTKRGFQVYENTQGWWIKWCD